MNETADSSCVRFTDAERRAVRLLCIFAEKHGDADEQRAAATLRALLERAERRY
jgi:hypothetical protein